MAQRDPRLIGGVYRTGQVVTKGGVLTSYTAHNRNTNNVVGLFVLEFPASVDVQTVQQFFQPMERRRSVESPHVMRVYDWALTETGPILLLIPRGVSRCAMCWITRILICNVLSTSHDKWRMDCWLC